MRSIQDEIDIAQLRDLAARVKNLERKGRSNDGIIEVPEVIPALVNFADNTDFVYSDEKYNVGTGYTAYTDDEDVLAHWYGRPQGTTTSWVENASATESSQSIRSSAHGSGARTGFEWNTLEGSLLLTGGYQVGTRLHLQHANAGNYFAVPMQLSRVLGKAAPTESIILKVSLWDNTLNKILEGSYPQLVSTKVGHDGSETVTRQYILEVQMPDGRKFYSKTAVFGAGNNEVINSAPTTTVSSSKFVNVTWPKVIGATRYRIYRRTPAEADTNWYLIGTVTNGSTSLSDYGGNGVVPWTVPTFDSFHYEKQLAQAFYEDIGELLQTEDDVQEVSVGLRIPYNFVPNGNQFLQIEFLKEDYTPTTTTEIDADAIRIDRVGLCYTNGRWTPSSRDNTVGAGIVVDPPPSGGGGDGNPRDGGGLDHCVAEKTPILVWSDDGNHYYVPADELAYGDRLVSWDFEKKVFAPSKITGIIRGVSTSNHIINTKEHELVCSFSHRLIVSFDDFKAGTSMKSSPLKTLCLVDGELTESEILSQETLRTTMRVITFKLKPWRNYIASGFLSHNLKQFGDPLG